MSRRSLVFAAVFLAMAVGWLLTLRPVQLGGPADYVMVRGTSMLPTFRTGDLVIVKRRPAYALGDVIAYKVPAGDLGAGLVVIHRIVGGSATDGFVTRGDNNPTDDEWRPTVEDVLGSPAIRVPKLGGVLAFFHAPLPLACLGAAIAIALVFDMGQKKRTSAPDAEAPSAP
jgi:signal peptidase I